MNEQYLIKDYVNELEQIFKESGFVPDKLIGAITGLHVKHLTPILAELAEAREENKRLREADNWISVEDRLPVGEVYKPIVYLVVFYGRVGTAKFTNGKWWWFDGQEDIRLFGDDLKALTHWQPLPNKPK